MSQQSTWIFIVKTMWPAAICTCRLNTGHWMRASWLVTFILCHIPAAVEAAAFSGTTFLGLYTLVTAPETTDILHTIFSPKIPFYFLFVFFGKFSFVPFTLILLPKECFLMLMTKEFFFKK